jgi:hypothetical protein
MSLRLAAAGLASLLVGAAPQAAAAGHAAVSTAHTSAAVSGNAAAAAPAEIMFFDMDAAVITESLDYGSGPPAVVKRPQRFS